MRQYLLMMPAAAALLSPALLSSGCVAGTAHADIRDLSGLTGFEKVDVSAGVEVVVREGPFNVKVDSRNGDFDKLRVEVRGDTLHISRESQGWFSFNGPHYLVTVSAPAYSGFSVSSGAQLEGDGLRMRDVKVEVSSGAHVELSGACSGLRLNISSGAHFDGESLKCESARVDASSGAHADAFATRSADGDASSGASISFHGKPATLEKDTSSGGSVRAL